LSAIEDITSTAPGLIGKATWLSSDGA